MQLETNMMKNAFKFLLLSKEEIETQTEYLIKILLDKEEDASLSVNHD